MRKGNLRGAAHGPPLVRSSISGSKSSGPCAGQGRAASDLSGSVGPGMAPSKGIALFPGAPCSSPKGPGERRERGRGRSWDRQGRSGSLRLAHHRPGERRRVSTFVTGVCLCRPRAVLPFPSERRSLVGAPETPPRCPQVREPLLTGVGRVLREGLVNVIISGNTLQIPVAAMANICDVNVAIFGR